MNIFQRLKLFLCNPGAVPSEAWHHEVLGDTSWSEDDEAWVGEYNSIQFLLSYERDSPNPPDEVVAYAIAVLAPQFDLLGRFERLKADSVSGSPKNLKQEIPNLELENIQFYRGKDSCFAMACLSGGENDRAWRFDMQGHELSNLSFDS
jgi:hypothetical protein